MKHRIIMSGGLGNQMFQYAFYLSMKERGKKCIIDDTLFHITRMHNGFELPIIFQLDECLSNPSILKKIWLRILRRFKPTFLTFCDKPYKYCAEAYQSCSPYFIGEWISPIYFDSIKKKIVESYKFHKISDRNIETANKMQSLDSVSIHIRRGDYLKFPNYNVCDEDYYRKSVNKIMESISSPMFYVFSNEPNWCEDFMNQFGVKFEIVDWNQGKDSYQDMYLMTQCKHNIIANSTFSWWGAWLNKNEDKIIIAPSKWFRNNDYNINCPSWHLINTVKDNG